MTFHKLSAGHGYTYLTRQVARLDEPHPAGREGLAAYYAERGESPGRWLGRGLDGMEDGPAVGDEVTEAQMLRLFGRGRHPVTGGSLGVEFTVRDGGAGFDRELARRVREAGPGRSESGAELRAALRSELGAEWFTAEHGRAPDTRELTDYLAGAGRAGATSVAGYDLTFSPVKSVSALWALADPGTAATVEAAHRAAVEDVIGWLEDTAVFTRLGRNGVRQVDVSGLVAVAFTHRDARTGDPDLHTHVAVSNKVQTLDGRWRALDGRVLHKTAVAASERYNTRLEAQLSDRLGVQFADRPGAGDKRPVREITGVRPELLTFWSTRRHAITTKQAELAAHFTVTHGRAPTTEESYALFAQANLMTRPAKHAPRSLAEQRAAWRTEAAMVLRGDQMAPLSDRAVQQMLAAVLHPVRAVPGRGEDERWVLTAAQEAVRTVSASRATWQACHVRAEVERMARTDRVPLAHLNTALDTAVEIALCPGVSIALGADADPVGEPAGLRRRDGASVFTVAGSQLYTSQDVIDAEARILRAAARTDGHTLTAGQVALTLLGARVSGRALSAAQEQLVRDLATSGRRVQLALAPAGTGKTTALGLLTQAWTDSGGTVIGLAPSAVAAAELGRATGADSDTIAKLLHRSASGTLAARIGPGTLVLVDEAGMAGTLDLDHVIDLAVGRGASVRLVGDTHQLAAVGAGGVLRDIDHAHRTATLDTPVRFTDPAEGHASLALRVGDPVALGFYLTHHRVHAGDRATAIDQALTAWHTDRAAGRDSVMLAATNDTVRDLNTHARRLRTAGQPAGREVLLHDGTSVSAGDLIVTRRNDRRLPVTATDWVKNGDRWAVTTITADGAIQARHLATGRSRVLPARYVRSHVELGYATTVHLAQGRTTDTGHTVLTGAESRHDLYVALTRGRTGSHLYLATTSPVAHGPVPATRPETTSVEVLEQILAREPQQLSATSQHRTDLDPAIRLHRAVTRYREAITLAGGSPGTGDRPLPWLPAVPDPTDPEWAGYLQQRHNLITTLAPHIRDSTLPDEPWAAALRATSPALARELAVWRAATGCQPDSPEICGPFNADIDPAYRRWLSSRVNAAVSIQVRPAELWRPLLTRLAHEVTRAPTWPQLASHLSLAQAHGYDIEENLPHLLARARTIPADLTRGLAYALVSQCPQAFPARRERPRANFDYEAINRSARRAGPERGLSR